MKWRALSVVALVFAFADASYAQPLIRPEEIGGWSVVPGLQVLAVHEDNLLVTAAPTTQGPFARVTPSLETDYRGPLGFFHAGYSFDSERHPSDLQLLNDAFARQAAVLTFDSKPSERSSISGGARYLATRRPEEVLDATGLIANVRHTVGFLANIAADQHVSESLTARVAYNLVFDDFGQPTIQLPGAQSVLHAASVSIARQKTPRTTLAIEYTAKLVTGELRTTTVVTDGLFWAHAVTARWTRAWTPRLTLSLSAGPRIAQTAPSVISATSRTPTAWDRQPEVHASLSYRNAGRRMTIAYGRSQELGYAASGFIDTESFEANASRIFRGRLEIGVRPGVYRNTLANERANSYRVDALGHYALSPWLSVDASFSSRYQDRALVLSDLTVTSVARARRLNRAAIGLTIRRPLRME